MLVRLLAILVLVSTVSLSRAGAQTDQETAADKVAAATKRLSDKQLYELKYKLQQGEEIRWTVEHVVSTKVQMAGSTEESSSRSETVKSWKVANVDTLGNMTFVHSIESINMWQQVGEEEPVTYNSRVEGDIPATYQGVAEKIGKPLAVFSISPTGEILDRKSSLQESTFGVGKVTIPLPEQPIAVGHQWHVATLLEATDENGSNRKLKARILYQLAKVSGHNAYIKFRTEVLTPIKSEKIRSTIMQQLTDGYLVFDMERGRPTLKRVEWDEKAAGFEGADSLLTYVGRMSESILDPKATVPNEQISGLAPLDDETESKSAELKTFDGKPVIRK